MNKISETTKNDLLEEAAEVSGALNDAVRDALEPFAGKVDSMWAAVETQRKVDEYDARAEVAYRQFLLNSVQPAIMRVFSATTAPLTVDNSNEEVIFTIYQKRHVGTPVDRRTGIFGGPTGGDFEAVMSDIEETIFDVCGDFPGRYK